MSFRSTDLVHAPCAHVHTQPIFSPVLLPILGPVLSFRHSCALAEAKMPVLRQLIQNVRLTAAKTASMRCGGSPERADSMPGPGHDSL